MALDDRRILMRTAIVGILVAGLALSACGRKGALEPPPGAKTADYVSGEDPAVAEKEAKPDRPFFLDGLL